MSDELNPRFREILAQADEINSQLETILPLVAKARRTYVTSRSDADRVEMERVEGLAQVLHRQFSSLGAALREASGLPDEVLEAITENEEYSIGEIEDLQRNLLRADETRVTDWIENDLARSLECLQGLLPLHWLAEHPPTSASKSDLLSITKGLRRESEFPDQHRLAQMISTTNDFLLQRPGYDHFAGATLVPQALQLGRYFGWLSEVGGHSTRLPRLWTGAGDQVDSTVFELLVAARCAEMGRRVEFMPETSEVSPDIRCHDPYPMVIECKRKRSLSDYEMNEETNMKDIFVRLEAEAGKKGLTGRFDLTLTVEAKACPKDEVVARLVSQRLARNPERGLAYPWGSVAYHPMPRTLFFGNQMRARSPDLLETAFGWNPDLPEWDGLIVRTTEMNGELMDAWGSPLALVWRNDSPKAIAKRAWSPVDLFGDAMRQIPAGEFGIVYLAYHEGAREEIADRRSRNLMDRLKAWEHAASIRVPISVLVRLYPRALGFGKPDLIESNVRLVSGEYGEPALFSKFPTTIFTSTPGAHADHS